MKHLLLFLAFVASLAAQPLARKDLSNVTAEDMAAAIAASGFSGGDLSSGPVTSADGVSSIADAALSIAKTSGLQTALNGKNSLQFVSVKDFGATGDGTTDDTAFIQAAIDNSGNLAVFFPPPAVAYKLTTELLIKRDNLHLFGVGFGGSLIRQSVATKGAIKQTSNNSYFQMEGLRIEGTSINTATAVGVDLTSAVGGYTFRHGIQRCIITNFATGLKTGSTTMFLGSHLQVGSCGIDIDVTGADIATFVSVGTGRSFGDGLSFPLVRSQGWKIYNNFSVTINNMDAGNCNQLMDIASSNVAITNANWENIGENNSVQVGDQAVLTLSGSFKVLGGTTVPGSTMIGVHGGASFVGTLNLMANIVPSGGSAWKLVGAYGANPHLARINYRGPVDSAPVVYMPKHTVMAKVLPLVPYDVYISGTIKSAPGSNPTRWGHWPGREDGGPSFASFMDDHFMFPLKNRHGDAWSDFVTENHIKTLGFTGTAGNATTVKTSLSSYALRAYEVLRAGETLILSASGITADNANLKKWTLDLAGASLFDSGTMTAQNVSWSMDAQIQLVSQWSSVWTVTLNVGGTITKKVFLDTTNFSAAFASGANGLNLTATGVATNDVVQYSSKLKWERGLLTMPP